MRTNMRTKNTDGIPPFFKPILWSYDFAALNAERHKKEIILSAINYGDVPHLRWIRERYGTRVIQAILRDTPRTAIRSPALRLASLLFGVNVKELSHAHRSPQ